MLVILPILSAIIWLCFWILLYKIFDEPDYKEEIEKLQEENSKQILDEEFYNEYIANQDYKIQNYERCVMSIKQFLKTNQVSKKTARKIKSILNLYNL